MGMTKDGEDAAANKGGAPTSAPTPVTGLKRPSNARPVSPVDISLSGNRITVRIKFAHAIGLEEINNAESEIGLQLVKEGITTESRWASRETIARSSDYASFIFTRKASLDSSAAIYCICDGIEERAKKLVEEADKQRGSTTEREKLQVAFGLYETLLGIVLAKEFQPWTAMTVARLIEVTGRLGNKEALQRYYEMVESWFG